MTKIQVKIVHTKLKARYKARSYAGAVCKRTLLQFDPFYDYAEGRLTDVVSTRG